MGGASRVGDWESGNTPGYVRADAREARFLVEFHLNFETKFVGKLDENQPKKCRKVEKSS